MMSRMVSLALLSGLLVMSGGLIGQDKKDDPKKDAPAGKQDKDDPNTGKLTGRLPQNWGKIGLTDDQKKEIYKIQHKYDTEIDKLDAKIKELRKTKDTEIKAILTPDQQKRLAEIVVGKEKDKEKDKK
jgi:Spy/CpxP family protein refolding chaperone